MRAAIGIVTLIAVSPLVHAQERGSSAPFISGDTFRDYCDFTYDELSKDIDPTRVKPGSTIFVKTDYLDAFFTDLHPQIAAPYILVTHNSDYHVPGNYATYLDDNKIIAWFGQNVENCEHPKMHRIPIGIANKMWNHGRPEIFQEAMTKVSHDDRPNLLYMNFAPSTFLEERARVVELFKDKAFCLSSQPKGMPDYLSDLARSKFVLSPRGNGLDCHRTWEALLMGAIPIVRTSSLDVMYEGLPVLIVQDWDEINEAFLNAKYDEIKTRGFDAERAFVAYWLKRIDAVKLTLKKPGQAVPAQAVPAQAGLPRSAVTYDLGGGRFGDQLIGYLHAKWISYRYKIPLLYKPFPYSEELALHRLEVEYQNDDQRIVTRPKFGDGDDFRSHTTALYTIPYFPEATWEHTPKNAWYYFPVDWDDEGFRREIKRLVAPVQVQAKLKLPKDRISVAVHMRLGGGFDNDETKRTAPLKLPPVSYYKEQIRHIYELLGRKPLYVYVFTDDNEPLKLVSACREFTRDLDIEYGCRSEGNTHDSNVVQDFFEITKFDCLIRAESNYTIVAAKIADFMIEISPAHFSFDSNGVGRVDAVQIKRRHASLSQPQTTILSLP